MQEKQTRQKKKTLRIYLENKIGVIKYKVFKILEAKTDSTVPPRRSSQNRTKAQEINTNKKEQSRIIKFGQLAWEFLNERQFHPILRQTLQFRISYSSINVSNRAWLRILFPIPCLQTKTRFYQMEE